MSCTGPLTTRITPSAETRQQLTKEIRSDFESITDFKGSATLTLDSPEQSGRVSSIIRATPFTSATIDIKTPFGGQAGKLDIRRGYIAFYTPDGALKYIGSPKDAGRVPGVPAILTGSQDLLRVLIGAINLPEDPHMKLVQDAVEEEYTVEYTSDSLKQQYWIDPGIRKVTKYQETDIPTGNMVVIDLSNYVEVNGIRLPRSIAVTQAQENRFFGIYYTNIEIRRSERANVE